MEEIVNLTIYLNGYQLNLGARRPGAPSQMDFGYYCRRYLKKHPVEVLRALADEHERKEKELGHLENMSFNLKIPIPDPKLRISGELEK